jgi:hypothetical protein
MNNFMTLWSLYTNKTSTGKIWLVEFYTIETHYTKRTAPEELNV